MRNQFFGAALLVAVAGTAPALAADLPVRSSSPPPPGAVVPVSLWNGFYFGVNGGFATGTWSGILTFEGAPSVLNVNSNSPGPYNFGLSGGFGGGQIGYNWEGIFAPRIVLGIEADFEGAGIRANGFIPGIVAPGTGPTVFPKTLTADVDFFATVRGRLGYDMGGWLLYGTGGFAYGHADLHENAFSNDTLVGPFPAGTVQTGFASATVSRIGWAAGAGVEWALFPHWSVKFEYLHVDLGTENVTFVGNLTPMFGGGLFNTDGFMNSRLAFDTFKGGVNFRF